MFWKFVEEGHRSTFFQTKIFVNSVSVCVVETLSS